MAPRKTSKFERLVVHAIKRLQDIQGSTSREISNYLSQEYDVPSEEIKRQVHLALRRGIDYGILQRQKGGTYVCDRAYLAQNNARKDDNRECSTAFQKLRAFRRARGKKKMTRSKSRRRIKRGGKKSRSRGRRGRGRRRKRAGKGKKRRGGRRRRRRRSRRGGGKGRK